MSNIKNFSQYDCLLDNPIVTALKNCDNILLCGCGGGYDMFSVLPIYFALKRRGKNVHLTNWTFTRGVNQLPDEHMVEEGLYRVNTNTPNISQYYFPERRLSEYFKSKFNEDLDIYTFSNNVGPEMALKGYQTLVNQLNIDAIVLGDGGTDSLMFGDEEGLGTPTEDSINIHAIYNVKNVKVKLLTAIGMGIDSYHGVNHGLFLENVAKIMRNDIQEDFGNDDYSNDESSFIKFVKDLVKENHSNDNNNDDENDEINNNNNDDDDDNNEVDDYAIPGFLGVLSLLSYHQESKLFMEAYESCTPVNSIVCASVQSSVLGKFGNFHNPHTHDRTRGSKLFMSPLMNMYWIFNLDELVKNILYFNKLNGLKTRSQTSNAIYEFRKVQNYTDGLNFIGQRKNINIPY